MDLSAWGFYILEKPYNILNLHIRSICQAYAITLSFWGPACHFWCGFLYLQKFGRLMGSLKQDMPAYNFTKYIYLKVWSDTCPTTHRDFPRPEWGEHLKVLSKNLEAAKRGKAKINLKVSGARPVIPPTSTHHPYQKKAAPVPGNGCQQLVLFLTYRCYRLQGCCAAIWLVPIAYFDWQYILV